MKALDTQVGGSHYKNLEIQPMELGYKLNASPVFRDVAKYITRDKLNRAEDLNKAIHCIQLEAELLREDNQYGSGIKFNPSKLIRQFAEQFAYAQLIFDALDCLFYEEHDDAIASIQKLIKITGN